jgi:hypothetical protein
LELFLKEEVADIDEDYQEDGYIEKTKLVVDE